MYRKAFNDTLLYILGVMLGFAINVIIYYLPINIHKVHTQIIGGIIQIILNAIIIRFVRRYFDRDGLFTFGLFTVQKFIINRLIVYKDEDEDEEKE